MAVRSGVDDTSPLRQMTRESITTPHLFQPRNAYRIATSAEEDDQPCTMPRQHLTRVLVTGASGILGYNIVRQLGANHPETQLLIIMRVLDDTLFADIPNGARHELRSSPLRVAFAILAREGGNESYTAWRSEGGLVGI
jgi:hypothetical protein